MSITFIIKFDIKPENRDKFAIIMQDVKASLTKVDGCLAVNIHQNINDRLSYVLVEIWQDQAAHQKHIGRLTENGEWDGLAKLLALEPVGNYYQAL